MSHSVNKPKDVIDEIRRKEYMLDMELSAEAEEGARNIRGTLNRTLRLLAQDLYSTETHFVLELVQNADDNSYPSGVTPELRFELEEARLSVRNNETGFTVENVRALCNAGKSTKSKREGYIGEKGIGFKSVFAVSDRPEIHSNGFHFRFDASGASPLGYVVPEWLSGVAEEPGTRIVLPAREDRAYRADLLGDLSAELLLFLRKLRRLAFTDRTEGGGLVAERRDTPHGVRLTAKAVKDDLAAPVVKESSYLLARHTLSVADVKEDRRPGVEATEIVLAFSLKPDGAALATGTPPVFAFLPIRTFGFNFIVQADFLLSSSREDIHRAWPWNLRIREHIAEAFARAVPLFKENDALASSFLDFVPNPADIPDVFFKHAATQIVSRLGAEDCVLGASGKWRKPNEILVASAEFRALFSNDDIILVLKKEYPSDTLTPGAREVLLRLGAVKASREDVAKLVSPVALLADKPPSWFTALYAYLGSHFSEESWLKRFRVIECVRTMDGSLKAMRDAEIFFPLQRGKRYGFEQELRIVDPAVVAGPGEDVRKAREYLQRLGVKEASPYTLIRGHILPRHAGDQWATSEESTLVGHVRYVKDHLREFQKAHELESLGSPSAAEVLGNGLYVRTRKPSDEHTYYDHPRALYLPSEYGPAVSLEELIGDDVEQDVFVHELYLREAALSEDDETDAEDDEALKREWRTFFYAIGVNPLPVVNPIRSGVTVDYEPGPHLKQLLGSDDAKTIVAAIRMIDRNWPYYADYANVSRHGSRTGTPSALLSGLRQLPVPTRARKRVSLTETYVNTETVRAVFGEALHYLGVGVTNTDFMDAVGITHRIDAEACFKRLDQLRRAPRSRINDIRHIYRALETRFAIEQTEIEAGLRDEPRVYILATRTWHALNEVVWESSGALLDSLYPPLEHAYREHRTFFCEQLKVARQPDEDALIAALAKLSDETLPLEDKQKEALQIYRHLATALRRDREDDPSSEPGWLRRLQSDALFLDHLGRLVAADNDLYVDDDTRLSDLFKDHSQISLLGVDRARVTIVQTLLDACGVPRISKAAELNLHSIMDEAADRELTARVRGRAEAIMRLVFHRQHGLFERAWQAGSWSTLQNLLVVRVGGLKVEARLSKFTAQYSGETFRAGRTLYVQRETRSAQDKVCQELCALIGAKTEMADALHRIVFAQSQQDVEDFLEVKGIPAIPADELDRWSEQGRAAPADAEESGDEEDTIEDSIEASTEDSTPTDEEDLHPDWEVHEPEPQTGESSGSDSDESWLDLPVGAAAGPAEADSGVEGATGAMVEGMGDSRRRSGGTGSTSRRPNVERSRRTGRLLSYVEPRTPDEAGTEQEARESDVDDAERRAVAAAAVAFVLEQERKENHSVEEMPFGNEGFDILRRTEAGVEEFIEVKGQSGPWTEAGVALTPPELRHAERVRERYFLYVVEFARDPERRMLYRIHDPYGKVGQFRFDSGWKGMATTLDVIEPAVGMEIELSQGTGTIVKVQQSGQFFQLDVQIGGTAPTRIMFVPGVMHLRRK